MRLQVPRVKPSEPVPQPAAAPRIVHDVLHSPGEALDPATRAFMESRIGYDFSAIRVHSDAQAAQSAAAVGALAYTVGNHLVFGERQYAPGAAQTRQLLAHELRHAQQQAGAATADPLPVAPPDTSLELDAAQAARRVLAGETGVGREAPRAPALVQRQPVEPFQLQLPRLGQSLRQPQTPLLPVPQLGFHLSDEDRQRIATYLTEHRLAVGAGFQPSLDGNATTIDAVVDAVRPLTQLPVFRSEIESVVQASYRRLVHDALFRVPITIPDTPLPNIFAAPPAARAPDAPSAPAVVLTAGANFAWHVNLTGPRNSSSDTTLQLQIGEDAPLQRIFQIGYNLNNQQVQVVVGGQATADVDLVKDLLKLSGFAQVLAGVAWTGTPASGVFMVAQPSAGAQLTLTWRGIQFAVQAAASITAVQDQPTTGEINVTTQIGIPIFPGSTPQRPRVQSAELTGLFEVRDWVDNARYSELERLPAEEKARLVRILLGSVVINMDVDSISRIWGSIDSPSERQQIRNIIQERIPTIDNPAIQASLYRIVKL